MNQTATSYCGSRCCGGDIVGIFVESDEEQVLYTGWGWMGLD